MEGESPTQASTPTGTAFLSYAFQDAEAAQRIREALRAAGLKVRFDKSELRSGRVWDQKIRRQIRECNLFMPMISANSQDVSKSHLLPRVELMKETLAWLEHYLSPAQDRGQQEDRLCFSEAPIGVRSASMRMRS